MMYSEVLLQLTNRQIKLNIERWASYRVCLSFWYVICNVSSFQLRKRIIPLNKKNLENVNLISFFVHFHPEGLVLLIFKNFQQFEIKLAFIGLAVLKIQHFKACLFFQVTRFKAIKIWMQKIFLKKDKQL